MEFINKQILANKYIKIFPQKFRTLYFINLFGECFGNYMSFCYLEEPLLCVDCINLLIYNTKLIIYYLEYKTKTEEEYNLYVYNHIILKRLNCFKKLFFMFYENVLCNNEELNLNVIYEFLKLDCEEYDPASKTIIDNCHPINYIKTNQDENCVICICNIEENEKIRKLPCHHIFHDECIMTWLSNHSTCPICKISLKDNVEQERYEPKEYLEIIKKYYKLLCLILNL